MLKKSLDLLQYVIALGCVLGSILIVVIEQEYAKAAWLSITGFGLYLTLVLNWIWEDVRNDRR